MVLVDNPVLSLGGSRLHVYGPRQDDRGARLAVIMNTLDRPDKWLAPAVIEDGIQARGFIYEGGCSLADVCAMDAYASNCFFNALIRRKANLIERSVLV